MLNPNTIQNIPISNNTSSVYELNYIPDIEGDIYNLNDTRDFSRYIKDIEKEVRGSFEYRKMISYFREHMDMNRCAFLDNTTYDSRENKISIEIHHYPLTLYDICIVVYNKRSYYNESLELNMVAKEVMQRHYELIVGLVPLSKTVHELAHNGDIFIPLNIVLGNWIRFIDIYKDFMSPEQLDTLDKIIEYNDNYNKQNNEEILRQNIITISSNNEEYMIPNLKEVYSKMTNRISDIKQNHYMLPMINTTKKKINPIIKLSTN